MDDQRTGAAPWGECKTVDGGRIFLLSEDDPLPEGVEEGDERVFVIRLVAATRETVEGRKCRVLTLNREASPSRPAIPASLTARGIA